nr:MAG TPA: hypothetical protein [Caudoviricetes sp.]
MIIFTLKITYKEIFVKNLTNPVKTWLNHYLLLYAFA